MNFNWKKLKYNPLQRQEVCTKEQFYSLRVVNCSYNFRSLWSFVIAVISDLLSKIGELSLRVSEKANNVVPQVSIIWPCWLIVSLFVCTVLYTKILDYQELHQEALKGIKNLLGKLEMSEKESLEQAEKLREEIKGLRKELELSEKRAFDHEKELHAEVERLQEKLAKAEGRAQSAEEIYEEFRKIKKKALERSKELYEETIRAKQKLEEAVERARNSKNTPNKDSDSDDTSNKDSDSDSDGDDTPDIP